MQEVKFRAWPKKVLLQRRGISNATFDTFDLKELMSGTWHFDDYERWDRYTGLRDRDGKEIYEGDIVKDGWQSWPWLVAWEDSLVATDAMDDEYEVGSGFNIGKQDALSIEVIGNIYENPELLIKKG